MLAVLRINRLAMNIVGKVFHRLCRIPCWGAKQGYGSSLVFEFGTPHLRIREPRETRPGASSIIRRMFARRLVVPRGDWHLWIHSCHWKITLNDKVVADNTSTRRRIGKAMANLNGQALVNTSVDVARGKSRFEFDLGGVLETKRRDRNGLQWLLYEPSGHVLSLRADGKYSHALGTTPADENKWYTLKGKAAGATVKGSKIKKKAGRR